MTKVKQVSAIFSSVTDEIDSQFDQLIESCKKLFPKALDKERFIEKRIKSTYDERFKNSRIVIFDGDIPLQEYFNIGWDTVDDGNEEEITENIYLWDPAVVIKVKDKINNDNSISNEYLKRVNASAKDEYILGAAHCLYYNWLKNQLTKIKNNTQTLRLVPDWKVYIDPLLLNRLDGIEVVIKDKISDWKQGKRGTGINCAAFCELLLDKGYFIGQNSKGELPRTFLTMFAKLKYGIVLKSHFDTGKDVSRNKHKKLLNHFFE